MQRPVYFISLPSSQLSALGSQLQSATSRPPALRCSSSIFTPYQSHARPDRIVSSRRGCGGGLMGRWGLLREEGIDGRWGEEMRSDRVLDTHNDYTLQGDWLSCHHSHHQHNFHFHSRHMGSGWELLHQPWIHLSIVHTEYSVHTYGILPYMDRRYRFSSSIIRHPSLQPSQTIKHRFTMSLFLFLFLFPFKLPVQSTFIQPYSGRGHRHIAFPSPPNLVPSFNFPEKAFSCIPR